MNNKIISKGYFSAPTRTLKNLESKDQLCPCCHIQKKTFIRPSHNEYEIICTDCLITESLIFAHNTEKGLVSKDPILFGQADEFDIRLHVPLKSIEKLMNTPNFDAPYDAPWLICCNDFMQFIGIWEASDFTKHSVTSGLKLFLSMTNTEYNKLWEELELEENETQYSWSGINYYAFYCPICKTKRGNWEYIEE